MGPPSQSDDMNRVLQSHPLHLQATAPIFKPLTSIIQGSATSTGLATSKQASLLPSTLIPYIASLLPTPKQNEVPFLYHTPRSLPLSLQPINSIVLSITPTPGFYTALRKDIAPSTSTLGFLHRPWTLDRRSVPPSSTVLACHKSFDEILTVGYNVALAARLGVDVPRSICLQGYKGDPERRIGLVGPLKEGEEEAPRLLEMICAEFGQAQLEGAFGFDGSTADGKHTPPPYVSEVRQEADDEDGGVPLPTTTNESLPRSAPPSTKVHVLAIMNAFHPAEIERVISAAVSAGFISSEAEADRIMYLTGAVRPEGLAAALERGMKIACVGHRVCEEWGIRWMARKLREEYRGLDVGVVEIYEDKEAVEKVKKKEKKGKGEEKTSSRKKQKRGDGGTMTPG